MNLVSCIFPYPGKTGRPGVLQSMGLHRVDTTERLNSKNKGTYWALAALQEVEEMKMELEMTVEGRRRWVIPSSRLQEQLTGCFHSLTAVDMLPVASALQRRPTTRDVPLNVNSQLSGETGSLDLQHNTYFHGRTTSAKVDFKLLMGCIECGVGKRQWWGQLQQAAAGNSILEVKRLEDFPGGSLVWTLLLLQALRVRVRGLRVIVTIF
ncbi:uncharacterized protein [Ovis canadensis]|uniref:uncharacterized protein n=1 Tax=Ovis canadensis TaxID=37174 RepID=UPI0037520125